MLTQQGLVTGLGLESELSIADIWTTNLWRVKEIKLLSFLKESLHKDVACLVVCYAEDKEFLLQTPTKAISVPFSQVYHSEHLRGMVEMGLLQKHLPETASSVEKLCGFLALPENTPHLISYASTFSKQEASDFIRLTNQLAMHHNLLPELYRYMKARFGASFVQECCPSSSAHREGWWCEYCMSKRRSGDWIGLCDRIQYGTCHVCCKSVMLCCGEVVPRCPTCGCWWKQTCSKPESRDLGLR